MNEIDLKQEKKRKRKDVSLATSMSVITTGTGIVLMTVGGPIGVIAGGIIIGAGLSGTISSV